MEEDTPTSEFNSGMASLMRLHETLKDCNRSSRMCHIEGLNIEWLKIWRFSILTLFREVSPKMSGKEIKLFYKKMKNGNGGKILKQIVTEQGVKTQLDSTAFQKVWTNLHMVEIYLRSIADKRGMLVPNKSKVAGGIEDMS